jgi:lipopolysaccharide/colanic/teichoic acid biosynthesis glycosyltransferase
LEERPPKRRRSKRHTHDLAYVLAEGAQVGRSRVMRDALSVGPLVLATALAVALLYVAVATRGPAIDSAALVSVAGTLALVPLAVSFVLVSLRDHEQPVTVAVFVTAVATAFAIAVLSALRVFMSYWAVLACVGATTAAMIVVMLRLRRAQTERVAMLDFPGAALALAELGGAIPLVSGAETPLAEFDRLLIDVRTHYSATWARFLLRATMRGVLVTPWVKFLEMRRGRVDIASFELADIVLRPSQILYSRVKRVLDLAGVLLALPFALAIGAMTGLYILVCAGRPVLFTQARRGHGGRTFTIVKFRTMEHDAGHAPAEANDRRIVPGLTLVRKLRLDEIPQLYNIWRGDMSWIGPRPTTLAVADATEAVEPKYASRLLVRPGLTGWAQVNSGYASTMREEIEKLGYDLYYIKTMSFDLDLVILARTVRILMFRIGAK